MPDVWYTVHGRVDEQVVPGKRLGRVVRHDSRNRSYPWQRQAGRELTSQLWTRHIPILDQGNVGSCTGNEQVGALGTDPLHSALPAAHPLLDENLALKIYSAAEMLDGDGPYPPQDNGSSGPSAAQVARNMSLISRYLHCFSLADVLDALEAGPVGIGSNWYEGMDRPDSSGLVTISGSVRGGHEYLCRGKDTDKQIVHLDNSWGTSFGVSGSFSYSYATLERLLAEQGDATVSLPLSVPAPVPVPVPPSPGPDTDPADRTLAAAITGWASGHHTGANARAARAAQTWLRAKGFIR